MRSFRGVGPCVTLPTHCIWPAVRLQYGCSMGWFVEKFRKKILFCHLVAFCRFYQSTTTARPPGKKHFCRTHRGKHPVKDVFGPNWPLAWIFAFFCVTGGVTGGGLGSPYPKKSCVPKMLQMHPPCEINGLGHVFRRKKYGHFWGFRCARTCHFKPL